MVTGGIRVIVDRVRAWIVIVDRARLIDDDASGLVVRNINDVIGDRGNLNDARVASNSLIRVALEITGSIGAVPE